MVDRNPVRQVLVPEQTATYTGELGTMVTAEDGRSIRVARRKPQLDAGERALVAQASPPQPPTFKWVGDLARNSPATVLTSLVGAFQFLEAESTDDPGLRIPQAGGVHAVLGYWSTSPSEPATVVMPTGTGKTETMLALLAAARPARLLVIVPSDALRTQIADKFETFGVLQRVGVVHADALRPVVGHVRHRFADEASAVRFAESCNAIVATAAALNASSPSVRLALLASCSHLFVDEAHHVPATTWRAIRDEFGKKPVVQFTATPFREDGRHLGGRLIYAFPLREAQRQGYFSNINYVSVTDLHDQDKLIAAKAVEVLRDDLKAGRDHLLLARADRIGRARDVLELYEAIAPDLKPVILHSALGVTNRRGALAAINALESRIIVCVDMLGEGFDLPSLKVAAIHDAHKSLGVTLQFVGRFARASTGTIGEATVVVGRPDHEFDDNLRRLYAENADWNLIIRDLSEGSVSQQQEVTQFEAAFGALPEEVSLRNLLPRMSTVVYRTASSDWNPTAVLDVYSEDDLYTYPIAINQRDHVAWFVTKLVEPVRWGNLQGLENLSYDLYILYWDSSKQLLYINSSNNKSVHEDLANAVCGQDAKRIVGESVYRVMAHVNRLVPTNVGLLDVRNRSRRFSMLVGADVSEGFPVAEAQTKTKTNIFAYGYEAGQRVSIGGSLKGRVWSYRAAPTLKHWIDWCDYIGAKLIDEGINIDEVMRHFIRPQIVEERPPYVPLALEWPWQFLLSTSEETRVQLNGSTWPLIDVDLHITQFSDQGVIPFEVATPEASAAYELSFDEGAMKFTPTGADAAVVTRFGKVPLSEMLSKSGLFIHFEQEALVVPPGMLLRPERDVPPFDPEALRVLDWSGVDLSVESQGPHRRQDSVQARALQQVLSIAEWDVVIDDDGTGEIADIVAMRVDDGDLIIHLTHCKYVTGGKPRAQVGDLYEVCGQAHKSATWRRNVHLMFQHLIRREKTRNQRYGRSGFIKGDGALLYSLEDGARLLRPVFTVAIAQPGLSKSRVSPPQLELLASVDTYIHETAHGSFEVYCNA
jgi:superfamily II DNA or RNA helicase